MGMERHFRFGKETVTVVCKEDLTVEKILDDEEHHIKTYLIKSPINVHALVQCSVRYIIVLFFELGTGYIKYKKEGNRDSFCFKCPDNNLESFTLMSFEHDGVAYHYGAGITNGVIQYHEGIFYIKRGLIE